MVLSVQRISLRLFGTKARTYERHSFLICNTFSRSADMPNKFRVIMFFKRPARSVGAYRACFDYVENRLEAAGFPPNLSGLDSNSRKPTQLFRLRRNYVNAGEILHRLAGVRMQR